MSRWTRAALAAGLAFLLAACARAGGVDGHRLVFDGLAGEPDTLNPMLSSEADELNFSHLYLSYLLENDERGETIPEIAREIPTLQNGGISSDQRTVTYHLRPGLRWQDGAPLTARDVAFSYRAIMDPRNAVPLRVGYEEVASLATPDDRTVVVHLKRPFSPFLQFFFGPESTGALIPEHLLATQSDGLNRAAYNQKPVGSGPYRVVEWAHGDHITLEANPLYWRGTPKFDRLVYHIVPDPNTRLQQLQTGESDAYFDVDPLLYPQLRSVRNTRVTLTPVNDIHVLRFNLDDPALRDATVRRAIAMAIDRRALIAGATHGTGIVVQADQPVNGWGYDASTPAIPYDPAGARRLLAGRHPDLTLAIAPQIVNGSQQVAALIQQNLAQVGIHVEIKQYAGNAMYGNDAILATGRFQIAYDAWWILGNDPDDSWNFACDQIPPRGINYSRWCASDAHAAMMDALATVDRTRRRADYALVQRAIVRDLPTFTLWQVQIPDAYRSTIQGIAPSPFGSTFWNVWSWHTTPSP